ACPSPARPLNYEAALSLARNAILGCNYDEAQSVAYTAELQRNSVATSLREHSDAGQRLGLSIYAPWIGIPHWRKTLWHRGRLKQATDHWTRAREKVHELQRTADSPKVRESIGQGAKDLLAAQKLRREADRAVRK
ncbi:hypothetical protein, partial [Salmonella enterica]|uniref:hypothetical protein n=1 Tax=Salmonella enterica TaxID=28901 RepID=UPI003525ED4C